MENSKDIKTVYDIIYICSTLKRVGPTNQTLNIIKYSPYKEKSVVITIFKEDDKDTMINEYKKEGINIISLNLNKKKIFSAKKKIRKILEQVNAKIVHSYGIIPDYFAQKASKGVCEHVITLRNFPKDDIFTRMNFAPACIAYLLHIKTLKRAHYLVTCSNTIKEKMNDKYKIKNIQAIQNGVDINKFKRINNEEKNILREKYNIKNQVVFISTSSFIPRKRIDETIQAFIDANVKDSILLLLGTGSEYERLYNKYKEIKNIKFIGKTNNVIEYLQLSDVFVSTSESEGLPNGVLEAISVGVPVLISDISQHKEILETIPKVGRMYKLGETKELSQYISDYKNMIVLNDKDYIADTELNMIRMSEKYVNYYKKILDRKENAKIENQNK